MAGFLRGLFSGGKYEKELKELKRKAVQDPKNHRLQVRIGDLLEKMGRRREALKIYRGVSERYARNGFLIQAIAVNKVILRLDPKETGLHDQIAELYARWGDEEEQTEPWLKGERSGKDARPRLPPLPLFGDLQKGELSRVMEKMEARRFARGEPVCREGDPGNSIFIISQGRVSVVRQDPGKGRIVLNELKEGDFFGEFGFFSNSRRQATVEALSDTEVLEIRKEHLEEMIREYPGIARVLFKFYRERVLDTLLATSSLFQNYSSGERRQVLEHLSLEEFPPGAIVLREGTPGDCLYIIKSGEVEVFTLDEKGKELILANLKEGDYFGEISLLSGRPRTASVRVLRAAELGRLSKMDFDRYVARRPEAMRILEDSLQTRLESKLRMLGVFRNSPAKEGMI